jgi:hypothetical protein
MGRVVTTADSGAAGDGERLARDIFKFFHFFLTPFFFKSIVASFSWNFPT